MVTLWVLIELIGTVKGTSLLFLVITVGGVLSLSASLEFDNSFAYFCVTHSILGHITLTSSSVVVIVDGAL